ncbi:MAG: succinate dehydrogenase assembly factor 2 [Pseudohongiellaceae bacterium]|jgi:antitoxin CptB
MTDLNKQKIYWHSRRGMLELDLLLMPFAQEVFDTLSHDDQLLYSELLEQEDQDLWAWLLERSEPPEAHLKPMITRILAHKASSA